MKKLINVGTAIFLSIAMTSVAYARYSQIGSFIADGNIYSTSANASALVTFKEKVDATLTLYLEESSNGGVSYYLYETLDTKSGFGEGLSVQGNASGLDKDCEYRIKAEVVVDGGETEYKYLY